MRLLRYNSSDDAFEVVNCSKDDILPYTILSYSWTTDREVKCEDLLAGARKSKANYAKIPSPESSERLSHYDGRQLRVYEIPCQVGKRKTKALGDTGAKHNFMRVSTARKWRLSVDLMMKRKVIVGSGKEVESPGTATAWFRFPREPQTYQLVFQLLPECVHDVILGKSFLKLSKTFTDAANFVKRVKERVIQGLQHFDLLYISGSTGPMFEGSLADKYQRALADTGAKVAVLDEDHAQKLGISFDVGFEHCNTLRFADDSRATTSGTAYGVPWRFGNDSMFYNLDFHVLKDAPAEVILPDTLLLDTMAFSKYAEFLIDDDDDGDDFSHCFLIDQDLKRQIQAGSSILDLEFQETIRQGEELDRIANLPVEDRDATWQEEIQRRARWESSMQVIRLSQTQSSQTSPSQGSGAGANLNGSGASNPVIPTRAFVRWSRAFRRR